MSEPSMNSLSNNEQKEDVKRSLSQAAGVVGDRVRPFSRLAGSMMTGTSAVFAKFAKQILFVLAVIIGSVGGAVWYYKSSHPTSMPAKPLASTSAATGSPKDLGAQGDNGKAPAPTPAAPASTPIPDQATPPNPKAPPLDGTVQLPPPRPRRPVRQASLQHRPHLIVWMPLFSQTVSSNHPAVQVLVQVRRPLIPRSRLICKVLVRNQENSLAT